MDYSAEIRRIYQEARWTKLRLTRKHVAQAVATIEHLFPPQTAQETFSILASLNLLNAAVKLPWGRNLVTYDFIKGMAARLFVLLAHAEEPHAEIYLDEDEDVAYFRMYGVQISFHHLPRGKALRRTLRERSWVVQQWDGIRLQLIALPLYRLAMRQLVLPSGRTVRIPQSVRRPRIGECRNLQIREMKMRSLEVALTFNLRHCNKFVLYRRKDDLHVRIIRYDGSNYQELIRFLVGRHPMIRKREEQTLEVGKLYQITPLKRLRTLSPSAYTLCLTRNSYLKWNGLYNNLCVTYGIARYLACLYPQLRFVCTLNYNRVKCHRKRYSYAAMLRVPLNSEARRLKVWMVADINGVLRDFDIRGLPVSLIEDYLKAEDFYQEFEITHHNGLQGIRAYRRHHLLRPCYASIVIWHYHAHVRNMIGKWAIYSLGEERFITEFIYDRIWFDCTHYVIWGNVDGEPQKIFSFFPE